MTSPLEQARDLAAEMAVLGGCLLRPEILGWLELEGAAFFSPRHRAVWEAMQALHRDGVAVDDVTVVAALGRMGRLDGFGGEDGARALLAEAGLRCPTTDNVVHYAEVLTEHLVTRRVLLLGSSVQQRAQSLQGEELLADVQRALSEAEPGRRETPVSAGQAVEAEYKAILAFLDGARGGQTPGIPTGIAALDRHTGGIPVGKPSVLAARPGVGKSTLARVIAQHAATLGERTQVLTWEDPRSTFAQRDLADAAGVDVTRIRSRNLDRGERARLAQAAEMLRGRDEVIVDHMHGQKVDRAIRRVRSLRREHRTRLVVVDYLQRIPSPDRRLKADQAIEANMHALSDLAGSDDLAVLVVSQLNREGEKENRRPRMSDLRGSGAIEMDAKLILALHEPAEKGKLEILVLKDGQGPKKRRIQVDFEGRFNRIGGGVDLDEQPQRDFGDPGPQEEDY